MRLLVLAVLLAAAPRASAQIGDVLSRAGDVLLIAHQFEGLDAPARTSMAIGLSTMLVVPALALASTEAGVPVEVALPVALAGLAIGPEAGFIAAGIPRAGVVGTLVRTAAIGGTAVLLLTADLDNAGLAAPAVVALLILPGVAIVTIAQGIDQARLRSRLLGQTRERGGARRPEADFGLVRGAPGVRLRVPLG